VYTIMPLHDCVYVQMHVFKGSSRILFVFLEGEYFSPVFLNVWLNAGTFYLSY